MNENEIRLIINRHMKRTLKCGFLLEALFDMLKQGTTCFSCMILENNWEETKTKIFHRPINSNIWRIPCKQELFYLCVCLFVPSFIHSSIHLLCFIFVHSYYYSSRALHWSQYKQFSTLFTSPFYCWSY